MSFSSAKLVHLGLYQTLATNLAEPPHGELIGLLISGFFFQNKDLQWIVWNNELHMLCRSGKLSEYLPYQPCSL